VTMGTLAGDGNRCREPISKCPHGSGTKRGLVEQGKSYAMHCL